MSAARWTILALLLVLAQGALDNYINLKARVENRMHAVVMTSTGDDDYINEDEKGDLEYRKQQLEQMKHEVVDLEDVSGGVSITDLGLNDFRMDLVSYYQELTTKFGDPAYGRIDEPTTAEGKRAFVHLTEKSVTDTELAGCRILQVMTKASGNQAPIGGIKVLADGCWFSARPSGTENIYKIYYESFFGPEHLAKVRKEAVNIVTRALSSAD